MKIDLSKRADKFLRSLALKQAKQIVKKMEELEKFGHINGSEKLHSAGVVYYRAAAGEYRIVYNKVDDAITISLIGKRNDGEIYLDFDRMSK
jgi:mRNA-degrading endonuclease RelE of RelBE toxin-antitoxin system